MSGKPAKDAFCPECFTDLTEGAVLCTHCGYNIKTGVTVETVVERPSVSTALKRSKPVGALPRAQLRKNKQKTKILIGIPVEYGEAEKLVLRCVIAGGVCGGIALLFSLAEIAGFAREDWPTAIIILGLTFGAFLKNRACAAGLLLYVIFSCLRGAGTDSAKLVPCLIGLLIFPKFLWDGVRGTTTFERADSSLLRSAITVVAVLVLAISTVGSYIMRSSYTSLADVSIRSKTEQKTNLEEEYHALEEAGANEQTLAELRFQITVLGQEIEQIKNPK